MATNKSTTYITAEQFIFEALRREKLAAAFQGFEDARSGTPSRALYLRDRPELADAYHQGFTTGAAAGADEPNPYQGCR